MGGVRLPYDPLRWWRHPPLQAKAELISAALERSGRTGPVAKMQIGSGALGSIFQFKKSLGSPKHPHMHVGSAGSLARPRHSTGGLVCHRPRRRGARGPECRPRREIALIIGAPAAAVNAGEAPRCC